MNGSRHKPSVSMAASIDLDVEGGGRLDEDYDAGWPSSSGLAWSAKGPAAYASSMSILQSAKCHLTWARAGWVDANRWLEAVRLSSRASEVRNGVIKGFLLSATIVAVIFFFELAFFPTHLFPIKRLHDKNDDSTAYINQSSFGGTFWLYPLIAGSYYLASSWTLDVAQATYRLKHGRGLSMGFSPQLPSGFARKAILESHRILLVINYTVISLALQQIPWIGRWLSFAFMSFIDAYYCFEQAWVARGWSLERRMRYAESRWAYMIAFGLPSTAVSFFHPSGLLNLMLFVLVFPICAIFAMLSSPQPRIAPTSASTMVSSSSNSGLSPGISNNASLSFLLPPRLPIFWFTVKTYRLILRFFPRLTDANMLSEPIMSADRSTNMWRPRPAGQTTGYGTGLEHTGYGTAASKRGATAAQFVGDAWNVGSRNGYATPPLSSSSPSLGPTINGWSTPTQNSLPPPPKRAGKKKD